MERRPLDPKHKKELRASGLKTSTIEQSGVYSANYVEVGKLLGDEYNRSRGLVYPYPPLDGTEESKPYVVIKLDDDPGDGKKTYRAPKGRGNRLYAPATLDRSILQDTSVTLCITEGQKKTLAAIQEGIPCVGLTGVWNWRSKDDKGIAIVIPDIDAVAWAGRRVGIVFDSDAAKNPQVVLAEKQIGNMLNRHGARVFAVRLPEGPDGEKVGLDDYLLKNTKEEFEALPQRELTEEWQSPLSFDEPQLPSFPIDVFPDWLQQYVLALSTEVQTPVDLAAAQVLGVLGTALAGKVNVEIHAGWQVPVNLWLAVRMRSGEGKSPVVKKANEPVMAFEGEERERLRDVVAAAVELYKVKRERLDTARKRAANAPKDAVYKKDAEGKFVYGDGNQVVEKPSRQMCEDEVRKLAIELASTSVPAEPRYLVDDITPEKLVVVMSQNRGRVAIVADEGGIFQIMGGRYSKTGEANLDIFLKSWAGDTPYTRDRIGDAGQSIRVEKPLITFVVSVQPDVFSSLQGRKEFKGRGLLARFLYSFPPSMVGRREQEPSLMDARTVDEYSTNMRKILDVECPEDKGYYVSRELRLSKEAHQVLMDFKGEVEPRFAVYEDMAEITDWGSKLASMLARIAGLLHVTELVDQDPFGVTISAELMRKVVVLGRDYYVPHAKAAFSLLGQDPIVEHAKYLIEFVRRKRWKEFSVRDLHRATGAKFETVSGLDAPIALLVDHEYLRALPGDVKSGPGRKASRRYLVNPMLYGEVTR